MTNEELSNYLNGVRLLIGASQLKEQQHREAVAASAAEAAARQAEQARLACEYARSVYTANRTSEKAS